MREMWGHAMTGLWLLLSYLALLVMLWATSPVTL